MQRIDTGRFFWNRLKRESSYYADTAKLFGMVPFKRLGVANARAPVQDIFHFRLDSKDMAFWQTRQAIELVYYFHPNARVYVHAGDEMSEDAIRILDTFQDSGYELLMLHTDVAELAAEAGLTLTSDGRVAAYLPLKKFGGVYVSKSTFLSKVIPMGLESGVSMRGVNANEIALMIYASSSDGSHDDELLLSGAPSKSSWKIGILSKEDSNKCLQDVSWQLPAEDDSVLGISLEVTALFSTEFVKLDTQCYSLLETRCIYCDEVHITF